MFVDDRIVRYPTQAVLNGRIGLCQERWPQAEGRRELEIGLRTPLTETVTPTAPAASMTPTARVSSFRTFRGRHGDRPRRGPRDADQAIGELRLGHGGAARGVAGSHRGRFVVLEQLAGVTCGLRWGPRRRGRARMTPPMSGRRASRASFPVTRGAGGHVARPARRLCRWRASGADCSMEWRSAGRRRSRSPAMTVEGGHRAKEENHFSPLITHSSPSGTADVVKTLGSEPPWGSVMEKHETIRLSSKGSR